MVQVSDSLGGAVVVDALAVRRLSKVFAIPFRKEPLVAVNGVSFSVRSGEVYGLLGPNGSGKSTTMKILMGLLEPSDGATEIFGRDSREVESRESVGFLPENPYFYKFLTGLETVEFFGKLCGLGGKVLRSRAMELLERVGLADAADRRLGGYSKGMLQRIGLAQALVQEPRLLVLDEPTAGVDPEGSHQIRDLILALKAEGITVLLCSHLLTQVQEICDRIGILHQGRLICEGALEELMAVEDQMELVVEGVSEAVLEDVRDRVEGAGGVLKSRRRLRTSLEEFFLERTREADARGGGKEESR